MHIKVSVLNIYKKNALQKSNKGRSVSVGSCHSIGDLEFELCQGHDHVTTIAVICVIASWLMRMLRTVSFTIMQIINFCGSFFHWVTVSQCT